MATISVMGATGHVGGRIAERLLAEGHTVRALGRSLDKLAGLKAKGAEVLTGDAADAAFLTRAFTGADGAFTLQPPALTAPDYPARQTAEGEAIAKAVKDSGVEYVVVLSSVGADRPSGTGPIAGLHAQEERLKRLPGVNVLALRPGFFFENFFATLPLIEHEGVNGGAVAGTTSLPMIATPDIGDVAARALAARDWTGFQVRELLGPRDLTHDECTRIIGAAIGKPALPYVRFPYADYAASLVQAGLSKSMADQYSEMAKAFDDGLVVSVEGRNAANTTPTTFESWVATVFAPALSAGAARGSAAR
jgi:uncharacterized protein YbjT (DUF2867 family)